MTALLLFTLPSCSTLPQHTASAQTAAASGETARSDYCALRDEVTGLISGLRQQYGIQGLSIALVDGAELVWSEGFGYADAGLRKATTPETLYQVGSISKLFTATAVMQLVERGAVDLDAPLSRYLPHFSIKTRFAGSPPITVRSLLTHHSGLPGDLTQGMWSTSPFTQVAERLWESYAAYPPNLALNYSNLGYTLLGHMVEDVSGEAFATHLEKAVLEPLGMAQSGFALRPEMRARLAKAYRDRHEVAPLPIRDAPAMGLYANALDLARFMQAVLAGGGPVLRSETLAAMLQVQNAGLALDFDTRVGLGWFLDAETLPAAGEIIGHGGTTPWSNAQLMILPRQRLGVVVLSNTGESREAVTRIAQETLRLATQRKTGTRIPAPAPALTVAAAGPQAGGDLAGRYATDFGLLAISPKRDKVCACFSGKSYDLVPYPDGWFGVVAPDTAGDSALSRLHLSTVKVNEREVMVARDGARRLRLLGDKLAPGEMPESWSRRVGRYDVLNVDPGFAVEGMEIRNEGGVLCLSYRMPMLSAQRIRVPIQAISDTEAVVLGPGRTHGETVHVTRSGGEERLHYSGYEARKRPAAL